MNTGLIECDLCAAQVAQAWVFDHGRFIFVAGEEVIDTQAGQIAACAECKPLVERRNAPALTRRFYAFNPQFEETPNVAAFHHLVLQHISSEPPKLISASEPIERALLIEDTCPRCGCQSMYDRRAAKNAAIETHCEGCGLQVRIGNIAPPSGWSKGDA